MLTHVQYLIVGLFLSWPLEVWGGADLYHNLPMKLKQQLMAAAPALW